MRSLKRLPLPPQARAYLAKRTKGLGSAGNTKVGSDKHWKRARRTKKIGMVIVVLRAMNGGSARCMYCEHDRSSDIDHFCPRAIRPWTTFAWRNMVWACGICNGRKREQFPKGLLNPTSPGYSFEANFRLERTTGKYAPLTTAAQVSEPIFGLNDTDLMGSRLEAIDAYQDKIASYADKMRKGELMAAARRACFGPS